MMKMLLDVSNDGQLLSFVPWGQKCRIRRVLNFDTLYPVTFKLVIHNNAVLYFCFCYSFDNIFVISILGYNFDGWEKFTVL